MDLRTLADPTSEVGSVYIDFENILVSLTNVYGNPKADAQSRTLEIIGKIDDFLEKRGIETIKRRAFCDWSQYPDAMNELYNMGVKSEHVKGKPGKNSADMDLSLTVMEDVLKREDINAFVIVAGDRDYMPIVNRVKTMNKTLFLISFHDALSGDLKSLVGPESVFLIDPKTGEIMGPDWQPELEPKKVSKEVAKVEKSSGLSDDQMTALRAAIEACDSVKPKFQTFKTGVFLMTYLATRLSHLTHVERKDVFSSLVKGGYVTTQLAQDSWGMGYSVFFLNETNETVMRLRKVVGSEPKPVPKVAEETGSEDGAA